MPTHQNGDRRERWRERTSITAGALLRGRFTGLMVVLLVLSSLVNVVDDQRWREMLIDVTFSVLLLFALWSVGPRLRLPTALFSAVAFTCHWSLHLTNPPIPRVVAFASSTAFLSFLTLVILVAVLRDVIITADTIVGALCAYFLMGVTWASAYSILALVSPGAFSVSPALAPQWNTPGMPFVPLLQYYSFTTLSTVGYGDITPVTAGARTLSTLEGITGQLYIAVLIARLVGIHTTHASK